jgi:hypothetical protein
MARTTDIDGAIELSRDTLDKLVANGFMLWRGAATTTPVESLLRRGADGDIAEAKAAIDTLAAVPTDPGYVLHELPLLRMRALLARAQGDETGYRDYRDRYRALVELNAATVYFSTSKKSADLMWASRWSLPVLTESTAISAFTDGVPSSATTIAPPNFANLPRTLLTIR